MGYKNKAEWREQVQKWREGDVYRNKGTGEPRSFERLGLDIRLDA